MAKTHPFLSIHSHGLIRVGACTPLATVGDPMANAEAAITLAHEGHKAHADLLVFPGESATGEVELEGQAA